MYVNILLSTDGSDVARKGVKHGIALAKALNANMGADTPGDGFQQEEADSFDASLQGTCGQSAR
jgi:hypothetical protein